GEGTKAGVEVVEPGVDQLHRQDLDAQLLADPLMALNVASKAIAGEEDVAAKEGVAGALEAPSLREPKDPKPRVLRPTLENGRLASSNAVAKPGRDEHVPINETGVGGED